MGSHSGYELLFHYLSKKIEANSLYGSSLGKFHKLMDVARKSTGFHFGDRANRFYDPSALRTEVRAYLSTYMQAVRLIHLAYVENQFEFLNKKSRLSRLRKKEIPLVGTIHQPTSWWRHHNYFPLLEGFDKLLVLTQFDEDRINEKFIAKAVFIPHGVDTDFFAPDLTRKHANAMHCLFVGQWLRDFRTLTAVIERIGQLKKDIVFDLVVPASTGTYPDMIGLMRHPAVRLHRKISDLELKHMYQSADVLFMPLLDCTANNGVLEGMASGLPVISTDIPGIKSYVTPAFSSLSGSDTEETVQLIIDHYNMDRGKLIAKGAEARAYTEQNLSWEIISRRVADFYSSISHQK